MKTNAEYLTKEKYDKLTAELNELKTVKRKEVAEHLEYAKALGDISENAEYHEARTDQANVEDRIMKIENILKSAEIISSDRHGGVIEVGSTVTVMKGGKDVVYTLVGSEEADVFNGKISISSPLGGSLIGKRKGEKFSCDTPKGVAECEILEVK